MHPLVWIGIVLEILGAGVVGLGVYDTFESFRKRGGEWRYVDRLTLWGQWLRRHVLRQKPRTHVAYGHSVTAQAQVSGSAFTSAGLPDLSASPEEFAAEVQRRLHELGLQQSRLQADLQQEARKRRAGVSQVQDQLQSTETSLRDRIEEVEVSGLRLEALGLLLVVVGTVFGAIGSVFGA